MRRTPKHFMLEGANTCRPMRQGQLDSLCGLYAAINAIRVVLAPIAPLTTRQSKRLMQRGVAALAERGLLQDALIDGMEVQVQCELVRALANEAQAIVGTPLIVTQPAITPNRLTRSLLLDLIDKGLWRGGAAIVGLEGAVSHYSTIVAYDKHRYMLMDSYRFSWIFRDSIGVAKSKSRYSVERAALVMVHRQ